MVVQLFKMTTKTLFVIIITYNTYYSCNFQSYIIMDLC